MYIHVPFCEKACKYCDFHFSTNTNYIDTFFKALEEEAFQRRSYLQGTYSTLYFGGGTPSFVSVSYLKKIISYLFDIFDFQEDTEITIEANPNDLTPEKLDALRKIGTTRLSIGVQSFSDPILNFIGRVHTREQSLQAIENAKKQGFRSFNLDLMYGITHQTKKQWEEDLAIITAIRPHHISAYLMTVEKKTVFGKLHEKKMLPEVDVTLVENMYFTLVEKLKKEGYEHYEVSNFCLPEKESSHNKKYWSDTYYCGLGPSAHSYDGISRQWNKPNNWQYIKSVISGKTYYEKEILTKKQKYIEKIMTTLRTSEGIKENEILDTKSREMLLSKGLLVCKNGKISIPEKKWLLSDSIIAQLI